MTPVPLDPQEAAIAFANIEEIRAEASKGDNISKDAFRSIVHSDLFEPKEIKETIKDNLNIDKWLKKKRSIIDEHQRKFELQKKRSLEFLISLKHDYALTNGDFEQRCLEIIFNLTLLETKSFFEVCEQLRQTYRQQPKQEELLQTANCNKQTSHTSC